MAAILVLSGAIAAGTLARVGSQDKEATKHCVAFIEPLRPGETASKVSEATCFDTLEESLRSIGADPADFEVTQ
jgi:hypothetical protein